MKGVLRFFGHLGWLLLILLMAFTVGTFALPTPGHFREDEE